MNSDLLLKQIAAHQMLYASFNPNIGLFAGKMGAVLFFFHYACYTNNNLHENFASELLDEIYDVLSPDLPYSFDERLCGIAWCVCYLYRCGFLEGNIDEALSEIDQKIMEYDPKYIIDTSIETGLQGIAIYVQSRLELSLDKGIEPFDNAYLESLRRAVEKNGIEMRDLSVKELIEHIRRSKGIGTKELEWYTGVHLILSCENEKAILDK